MESLFLRIVNMSITAGFVIAAITFARLALKRAPKIISYVIWLVAAFRLIIPFSFHSLISLIPFKPDVVTHQNAAQSINSATLWVAGRFLNAVPAQTEVNTASVVIPVLIAVWVCGMTAMLLYAMISFFLVKRRLCGAVRDEGNVYAVDGLKTPFVLGVFKPSIYIPNGLLPDEKQYVILHERVHIKRHDHLIKLAAQIILCVHWFNPLAWVAFLLMSADMELSCDERVLKEAGGTIKKDYSRLLLSLAAGRRILPAPLAFSEGGIKMRIRNVMKFKEPKRQAVVVALIFALVLGIGFAADQITPSANTDVNTDTASSSANTVQTFTSGGYTVKLPAGFVNNSNVTKKTAAQLQALVYAKPKSVQQSFDNITGLNISGDISATTAVNITRGGSQLTVRYNAWIDNQYIMNVSNGVLTINCNIPYVSSSEPGDITRWYINTVHAKGGNPNTVLNITIPDSVTLDNLDVYYIGGHVVDESGQGGAAVQNCDFKNVMMYNVGDGLNITGCNIESLTLSDISSDYPININSCVNAGFSMDGIYAGVNLINCTFTGSQSISNFNETLTVRNCAFANKISLSNTNDCTLANQETKDAISDASLADPSNTFSDSARRAEEDAALNAARDIVDNGLYHSVMKNANTVLFASVSFWPRNNSQTYKQVYDVVYAVTGDKNTAATCADSASRENMWNLSAWKTFWQGQWQTAQNGGYLDQLKAALNTWLLAQANLSGSYQNYYPALYALSIGLLDAQQ